MDFQVQGLVLTGPSSMSESRFSMQNPFSTSTTAFNAMNPQDPHGRQMGISGMGDYRAVREENADLPRSRLTHPRQILNLLEQTTDSSSISSGPSSSQPVDRRAAQESTSILDNSLSSLFFAIQ